MRMLALATLTAAALTAPAALAQPDYDASAGELTVTGHVPGYRLRSLSERVSYADLDLNRAGDRHRLETRVNIAARRICTQLNQEGPGPANMGRSCQEIAVRDAMGQVRQAYADAASPAYVDRFGAPTSATAPDVGAERIASPGVSTYSGAGPIPDTAANRARYGGPVSKAGKRTSADGR